MKNRYLKPVLLALATAALWACSDSAAEFHARVDQSAIKIADEDPLEDQEIIWHRFELLGLFIEEMTGSEFTAQEIEHDALDYFSGLRHEARSEVYQLTSYGNQQLTDTEGRLVSEQRYSVTVDLEQFGLDADSGVSLVTRADFGEAYESAFIVEAEQIISEEGRAKARFEFSAKENIYLLLATKKTFRPDGSMLQASHSHAQSSDIIRLSWPIQNEINTETTKIMVDDSLLSSIDPKQPFMSFALADVLLPQESTSKMVLNLFSDLDWVDLANSKVEVKVEDFPLAYHSPVGVEPVVNGKQAQLITWSASYSNQHVQPVDRPQLQVGQTHLFFSPEN